VCIVNQDGMVVLLSQHKQPVGLGKIVKDQVDTHLQLIPTGYIKVSIEYVQPGTKPPIASTFDGEELETGQFTNWPRALTTSAVY